MARIQKGRTTLATKVIASETNAMTIALDRSGWSAGDSQEIIVEHEVSLDGLVWVPWGRCTTVGGAWINPRTGQPLVETFYQFFLPRTRQALQSRINLTLSQRQLDTTVETREHIITRALLPRTNSVGFEDSDSASFDGVTSVDLTGLTVTAGNCVAGFSNINWNAAYTVTGINWDQSGTPQALTQIINHNGQSWFASEIWRRLAPTTGNRTMRFSFSNTCGGAVAAYSLTSVDQTTPTGTPVGANGNSTAPTVAAIGSATGELVVGLLNSDVTNAAEAGTNHLEREILVVGSDSHSFTTKPGATTVQLDWMQSSGAWVAAGVSFKEAAGGGFQSAWAKGSNQMIGAGRI